MNPPNTPKTAASFAEERVEHSPDTFRFARLVLLSTALACFGLPWLSYLFLGSSPFYVLIAYPFFWLVQHSNSMFVLQERPMGTAVSRSLSALLFFALTSGILLSGYVVYALVYSSGEWRLGLCALLLQSTFSLWMVILPLMPRKCRRKGGQTELRYQIARKLIEAWIVDTSRHFRVLVLWINRSCASHNQQHHPGQRGPGAF